MQSEPEKTAPPRSKLEYMYRDLLVECDRLSTRNEALATQIRDTAMSLGALPTVLRQSASTIAVQASSQANRQIQDATQTLVAADHALRRAHQSLHRASLRNAWFVACVSALCGLAGGLLSALIVVSLVQG